MPREIIALLGGTFNPVHCGHLAMAHAAQHALGLDEIRFLPAKIPPHKDLPEVSETHRLNMLRCALSDEKTFRVEDWELHQDEKSYTVRTLDHFRRASQAASLILIVGQDSFARLETWFKWERLLTLAHIVVISRPGVSSEYSPTLKTVLLRHETKTPDDIRTKPAGHIYQIANVKHDVSATEIRDLLKHGSSVEQYLAKPVVDYINHHHLYQIAKKGA